MNSNGRRPFVSRARIINRGGRSRRVLARLRYQTLFGLAAAILAGATLLAGEYPRWVCWLGLAAGVVWGIAGILIFTQAPGAGFWLVFIPVLPVALWMLGVGWLAWRRGSELATTAGQPSPAPAR